MTVTKFHSFTGESENAPPIARLAFSEVVALLGSVIQLDGRRSSDPEGDPLTYHWAFTQVPIGSGITAANIKPLRPDWSAVSFIPDKLGAYVVQFHVNDGVQDSTPVTAVVDIQISKVPCGEGIIPDAQFLWSFLSDFWNLLEDRAYFTSAWSSIVQLIGSDVITLWSNDYNKSLKTVQATVQRRWQRFSLETNLLNERQTIIAVNKKTGKGSGDNGVAGNIGVTPGVGQTAVFHAPFVLESADFEKLNANYGAKGRIIVLNGKGHTIDRVYRITDPSTSEERSVAIMDREDILDGIVGVRWRIPHLLYVPGVDLEASGVRTGDLLILEVKREDTQLVSEIAVQVVGVDRTRLGFEFSRGDLSERSTDTDIFRQVVLDLRIVPPESSDSTITAAAKTLMSYMPVGINLVTRPFSPYQFTIRAKKIIHNTSVPVDEVITSVPALQASLYDPEVVLRENLDYVVEQGLITFVEGLFTPLDPAPSELWAECVFIDNSLAIEDNFGRMVGLLREDLTQKQTRAPYLSAVKGLFYAATTGPKMSSLRLGLQILLGLPFAEERGKIIELEPEYSTDVDGNSLGRFLIEDVDSRGNLTGFRRLYFYPSIVGIETNPSTLQPYVIGEVVEQWAPLSKGVDVQDRVTTPDLWKRTFGGLEILKFFTFKVLVDGEVFDYNDAIFALDFIRRIKPAYTKVVATAFKNLYEDIEVDEVYWSSGSIKMIEAGGSRWGLESSIRADDISSQGFVRWRFDSHPFSTRSLRLLRDIETYQDGVFVMARSATGWGTNHVRGRIEANAGTYPDAPVVEGDILVILRDQPGATLTTDDLYEIEAVVNENTLRLLQRAPAIDPTTLTPDTLDASTFQYGNRLSCTIVRRALNPVIVGSDMETNGTDLVTSLSAQFRANGVGVDDHLVIETGANKGEYRIEAVTTSPLSISNTQVRLRSLNGASVSLPAATDQRFRVIRYSMQNTRAEGIHTVAGADIEVNAYDMSMPRDIFTPGMVGTVLSVGNSENPENDGQFLISEYVNAGRVRVTNPSAVTDTIAQARIWITSKYHPGFERVEEGTPSEVVTFELVPV